MRNGHTWLRAIGIGLAFLASGAAAGFDAVHLRAATPPTGAAGELKDLSVDEIRRRLASLEAEANAALADEDYERAARRRREMLPLEEEIVRRDRAGTPSRPPDFRVPRR